MILHRVLNFYLCFAINFRVLLLEYFLVMLFHMCNLFFILFSFLFISVFPLFGFQHRFKDLYRVKIILILSVFVVGIDEILNGRTKSVLIHIAVFMQVVYIGWHSCVALFELCWVYFSVNQTSGVWFEDLHFLGGNVFGFLFFAFVFSLNHLSEFDLSILLIVHIFFEELAHNWGTIDFRKPFNFLFENFFC